jgi:hypothetical protein
LNPPAIFSGFVVVISRKSNGSRSYTRWFVSKTDFLRAEEAIVSSRCGEMMHFEVGEENSRQIQQIQEVEESMNAVISL